MTTPLMKMTVILMNMIFLDLKCPRLFNVSNYNKTLPDNTTILSLIKSFVNKIFFENTVTLLSPSRTPPS